MELQQFVAHVKGFAGLSHPEKITHFVWYLHAHGGQDRVDQSAVRECYVMSHVPAPNLSKEFSRLLERRPAVLLKDSRGYRLALHARSGLDEEYAIPETTVVVSRLLSDLSGKIPDDAERLFLSEALKCYRATAFRAAIVMTWNLAYDHVLNWLLGDVGRLSAFNARIAGRIGAKRAAALTVATREEFEELKEGEVLDIASALLPSTNIKRILDGELAKRNMAAHPSLIEIDRPQADEAIFSLVSNVVLKLT
jgi:hypothetical protein